MPMPRMMDDNLLEYIIDSNKIPHTFLFSIIISLGHFIKALLFANLFIDLQIDNPDIRDKDDIFEEGKFELKSIDM